MATSLSAFISIAITGYFNNAIDLVTAATPLDQSKKVTLTNGTTADKADLYFSDTRTVTASGTDPIDLAGSLSSVYGATLTYVELKAVIIIAAAANTNNVRFNRPASNGVPLFLAASDGIDIPPGGFFAWAHPADGKVTVTAATGDILNCDNSSSGTSVTYDIVLIGASA